MEWLGDGETSSFILNLGSVKIVAGFELCNAATNGRSTTQYTIEASTDAISWKTVLKSTLKGQSGFVQVACDKRLCAADCKMQYVKFIYESPQGQGGGLRYFAALNRRGEPPTEYVSSPEPPRRLWDVSAPQFLDLVKCHAVVRVTSLDPKMGMFSLRMNCHWRFRTLKEHQGSEVLLRGVPGIRMPSLREEVIESRFWKVLDADKAGSKTIYWEGTSTFYLEGFRVYHMENFPFDRQLINLEQLHFVWRPDKNAADFYKPMKVVCFTIDTISALQQWKSEPAYIVPIAKYVTTPKDASDPTYASSFIVKLRVEHQHGFYISQVFFPALLMTITSIVPLVQPPMLDDMADRQSVYGGGLLTLIVFKYAIAEHLPSVPYSTFTDRYLRWQLVTVSACMFVSANGLNTVLDGEDIESGLTLQTFEHVLFFVLAAIWLIYFLYAYWYMPYAKPDWRDVWSQKQHQTSDISFFETCGANDDNLDFREDVASIVAGMQLEAVRDRLTVWDLNAGEPIGKLKLSQHVRASGAVVSTDDYKKRFDPEDDKLYTQEGLKKKYMGQKRDHEIDEYWSHECESRVIVPIKNRGAVEWRYMRIADAVDSVVEDVPMMETESNSSVYKAIADKSPVSNGTTVHIGSDVHRQAVHTI
jgi:hypothetical protein